MKKTAQLIAAITLFAITQAASAVSLVPGVTTSLPGTTVAAEPQLAGTVLADTVKPFSITTIEGLITGTVQSRVVRSSVDGTLDFYWRVINDQTSDGNVGSFRLGDFIAPEYNANWRIDGLGNTQPSSAYRFGAPFNGYVNFSFEGASRLAPGKESYFLFLDTSAKSFSETAVYDLTSVGQDQISPLYSTYAPAVPEPSTYALMLLGIAGLTAVARRRK